MNLHYSKTSKRYSKLLPVHVSQGIQLHFIISLPFFQKNILSAMLVQICSTTLRFCTSSGPQRDIWSCYRRKMHAITLLQNTIKDYLTLLFVLLPYEFTLLQNLKRRLKLLPVHVSQDIQLHLIISPPFCQKHIDYHIYARLFNYPAILHLFKCSNRHLKLLPAQKSRKYTTPKPNLVLVFAFLGFTALWIYTTPKPNDINKYSPLGFTALWIYTTPKPQKRIFEAATSACITGLSIASYHIAFLLSKTYWLPYLCKFVQLPCNFAPLQMLK